MVTASRISPLLKAQRRMLLVRFVSTVLNESFAKRADWIYEPGNGPGGWVKLPLKQTATFCHPSALCPLATTSFSIAHLLETMVWRLPVCSKVTGTQRQKCSSKHLKVKTRRTGNVPFGQAAAMDRHAIGLKVEQKGDDFRVSFEEPRNVEAPQREHGPIHPVLTTDPKQVEFDQLNQFLKGL